MSNTSLSQRGLPSFLTPHRLLTASMLILLSLPCGCAAPPATTVLSAQVQVPQPPPVQPLALPAPVSLQPLKWSVVTAQSRPSGNWSVVALSPEGYEDFQRNMAEITRWSVEMSYQLHRLDDALTKPVEK